MRITRIESLEQLQDLAPEWNRLAGGVPFRTWQWLHSWWRFYGDDTSRSRTSKSLFVLAVHDPAHRLIGIAPWFVQRTALSGNVVRMLGSGEVCSDYLSILAEHQHRPAVVVAIAQWLAEHTTGDVHRWDALELDGVAEEDAAVDLLAAACEQQGLAVRKQPGPNFWRLDLPGSWDDYLAQLSKSHRKQLRRLDRRSFGEGRARVHRVHSRDDLERAWPVFKRLHQLRRQANGQRGCFASTRFEDFQDHACGLLVDAGILQLDILELDGRPVAAEYDLVMDDVVYAYQSGLDPAQLSEEPGRILQLAVLQQAIQDGRSAVDFLRGDEPYKAHWRAIARPSVEVRITPRRIASAVRGGIVEAGSGMKQLIKSGLTSAGLYSK